MNLILLLILALLITIFFSYIFIRLFKNENKILNGEMFKLVGSSGIALTEISELFGVVSFKDDFGIDKNIVCYSYRENISKGIRVLITDYNSEKEIYIVDEYPK
jgi:hypothetical protein